MHGSMRLNLVQAFQPNAFCTCASKRSSVALGPAVSFISQQCMPLYIGVQTDLRGLRGAWLMRLLWSRVVPAAASGSCACCCSLLLALLPVQVNNSWPAAMCV